MDTPLDDLEKTVWQQILKEFPSEVLCMQENLMFLGKCTSILFDNQPLLHKSDCIEQLKKVDKEARIYGVWTLLLQEALERVCSARLLLLTGHQSRCLSCIRDAFECLRWADICLKDERQANCWLGGKGVKAQLNYVYARQLSHKVNADVQGVLNREGTHAYAQACLISSLTRQASQEQIYRSLVQRSFVSILWIIDTTIGYAINTKPFLRDKLNIDPSVILRMTDCYNRNVKSLRNAGFL